MNQPLLEGRVEADEVTRLRREIVGLEAELKETKDERDTAKVALKDSAHVIRIFRERFAPFHDFLKFLYGEAARVDLGDTPDSPQRSYPTDAANPRVVAVWGSWKQKLGKSAAVVIDALLLHGEMTNGQIAIASGLNRNTVTQAIYILNKASLINKNGGKFSLKEI